MQMQPASAGARTGTDGVREVYIQFRKSTNAHFVAKLRLDCSLMTCVDHRGSMNNESVWDVQGHEYINTKKEADFAGFDYPTRLLIPYVPGQQGSQLVSQSNLSHNMLHYSVCKDYMNPKGEP